jgi:hypothetical protein
MEVKSAKDLGSQTPEQSTNWGFRGESGGGCCRLADQAQDR